MFRNITLQIKIFWNNVKLNFPILFQFFNTISYIIGGHSYSLNDIENGILRANRKAIGALKKPFGKNDPRLAVALSEPEPKVHFGLVCGAKSCPPIKTYTPKVWKKCLTPVG